MLQGISPARLPAASQQTVHHVREPTWPPSLGKPSDDKHLTATHAGAIPLTPSRFLTHRQGWSETVHGPTCYAGYDTATATWTAGSRQWQSALILMPLSVPRALESASCSPQCGGPGMSRIHPRAALKSSASSEPGVFQFSARLPV